MSSGLTSRPTSEDGATNAFQNERASAYKTRPEAERALAEIIEDGGQLVDFRIDEYPDGTCVIIILERDGRVAGMLGV